MKEINFENLNFNEIILSTEKSLSRITPSVIMEDFNDKFCLKSPFKCNENKLLLFRGYKRYQKSSILSMKNFKNLLNILFNKYTFSFILISAVMVYYLRKLNDPFVILIRKP